MDWTCLPSSCIVWEYRWNVRLDRNDQWLHQEVANEAQLGIKDQVFSVHLRRVNGRVVKIFCSVRQSLLEQHLGCTVKMVTCSRPESSSRSDQRLAHLTVLADKCSVYHFDRIIGSVMDQDQQYVFRLYLTASSDDSPLIPGRFDTLLAGQLWAAAVDGQTTDVTFQVGTRTFTAHKFVLAARSQVFEAMLGIDMIESRAGRIEIDDVDPDTFRQLLYFLYTGRLEQPINAELDELADMYLVDPLTRLFDAALASTRTLGPSQKIPKKETDITTGQIDTYDVDIGVGQLKQNVPIAGHFYVKVETTDNPNRHRITFTAGHGVSHVEFRDEGVIVGDDGTKHFWNSWATVADSDFSVMDRSSNDGRVFTTEFTGSSISGKDRFILRFVVHQKDSKGFAYQFRDANYAQQLWSSSVNGQRTDVEFQVGDKIFSAHRALLAARCPALLDPSIIPVDLDPAVFQQILHFLYTGESVQQPDDNFYRAAKLFEIAAFF